MTEQQAKNSESYCEVCEIDVTQDIELKRFGKFFCSNEHMDLYVKAKQRELRLKEEGYQERRRERRWFGGGCG